VRRIPRKTVKRSDLTGHTDYRYCASHSRFYWRFRLCLLCTPDGMPVVWGLTNPKTWGTRSHRNATTPRRHDQYLIQPRQVIVRDKGFAGHEFERFITDALGAHPLRPNRKDKKPRSGKLDGIRQSVESVFDTLKGQLTLEQHPSRTPAGVYSRVAAKLLTHAARI
jgi:Transposase DDE domain